MGSKSLFFQWKNHFTNFFMDKYLKLKEIVYLIHDVKLEMCPTLFLVKSHPFFQE